MTEIVREIYMENIDDPEHAMRTELDRDALFDLADNIKQNGLINPITVRPRNDRYEVVAGHRRFSACKIAGMSKIACVVRELDDNQAFAVMAAENLERADVDPVDEAIFISKYIKQTKQSVPEVAKSLRRSVVYVESRLSIGNMPEYMQAYIKSGALKLGAALALVQITKEDMRKMWCDMAARDGVSVAQAEYWLHGFKMNQLPGGSDDDTPPEGYEPGAVRAVMLECALDGKRYDVRFFKSAMIYEGNWDLFQEIIKHTRAANVEELAGEKSV